MSAAERLAGSSSSSSTDAVQAQLKAIDTNGDSKISSSETDAFIKKLSSQVDALTQSTQNSDTSNSSASASSNDNLDLVNLVRKAYEQIANGLAQPAKGATLSAEA